MSKPDQRDTAATSLHGVAADNLRFIRTTMENATAFTGISGKGYALAGLTAIAAAWIAAQQTLPLLWLAVWLLEATLACSVTLLLSADKARRQGKSLWSGSGRKLLFAFLPTMAVGAVVTLAFYLQGNTVLLPGLWLILYGAGVMTAGAHSIRPVPLMGFLFIMLGSAQLLVPATTNLTLALGFGGLHLAFGILIWRQHGG
jgi:hypothetical protein